MNCKNVARCMILVLAVLIIAAALPTNAQAVLDCNAFSVIGYTAGPNYADVGSVYTVQLGLFTGAITGGTKINISGLSYGLDCTSASTGSIPCTDLGLVVKYQGDATLSSTCGVGISSNIVAGGDVPNTMAFTFASPVSIAPNTGTPASPFCVVTFDVMVESISSTQDCNGKPCIPENAGFSGTQGACDNGINASNSGSAAILACPACNACQECNTSTGVCEATEASACGDNLCQECNTSTGACVATTASACGGNQCQECNTATGVCVADAASACNGNECLECRTSDGACVATVASACGGNQCQECNTATGVCVADAASACGGKIGRAHV